jgi:hypothetical protein
MPERGGAGMRGAWACKVAMRLHTAARRVLQMSLGSSPPGRHCPASAVWSFLCRSASCCLACVPAAWDRKGEQRDGSTNHLSSTHDNKSYKQLTNCILDHDSVSMQTRKNTMSTHSVDHQPVQTLQLYSRSKNSISSHTFRGEFVRTPCRPRASCLLLTTRQHRRSVTLAVRLLSSVGHHCITRSHPCPTSSGPCRAT